MILGTVAIIAAAIAVPAVMSYTKQKEKVVTICDKERTVKSDGSGAEYRIYTDHGTFVMKDTFIGGFRYNTADAYGRLRVGKTYSIKYYGWRFGLTSSFPNITHATKLPPNQQQPHACD
ncbi:MAG TPA: hypothetical protein VG964_00195 [Candidatus Saccharimonadales bacterium]|nr:hypothetical protein [Candidatus Saccharimonadales bacterium]